MVSKNAASITKRQERVLQAEGSAGDPNGPRLWIVPTSRRSVAQDQERSGYPGRPVNHAKQTQRTTGPFYTCHAERSEASQRDVAERPCCSVSARYTPRAPDGTNLWAWR